MMIVGWEVGMEGRQRIAFYRVLISQFNNLTTQAKILGDPDHFPPIILVA